jgi:hypothetical protein
MIKSSLFYAGISIFWTLVWAFVITRKIDLIFLNWVRKQISKKRDRQLPTKFIEEPSVADIGMESDSHFVTRPYVWSTYKSANSYLREFKPSSIRILLEVKGDLSPYVSQARNSENILELVQRLEEIAPHPPENLDTVLSQLFSEFTKGVSEVDRGELEAKLIDLKRNRK